MGIPLTTRYDTPSHCTEDSYLADEGYNLLGGSASGTCFPPSYTATSTFFYTPGLYCPNGYSTACSSTEISGDETVTVATCCPTLYNCQTDNSFDWETTLGCISAGGSGLGGTYAYSIQLRFQTDAPAGATQGSASSPTGVVKSTSSATTIARSTLSTAASTASPVKATTAAGTSLSSNGTAFHSGGTAPSHTGSASSSAASENASHAGLSAGATAGIAVGSVLGLGLVAAIVYLAWSIGRKTSKDNTGEKFTSSNFGERLPGYYSSYSEGISPLPAESPLVEMGEPDVRSYELPVDAEAGFKPRVLN